MTILVTGSTGKTASAVASQLPASHPPLVASRKGPAPDSKYPTVRFDWHDASTYSLPFEHEQAKKSPITAIYLVSPPFNDPDPAYVVIDFIKYAKSKGVNRFVLLSQMDMDESAPRWYGLIHKYLKEESGVEWAVMRPTFFMEQMSDVYHRKCIKEHNKFHTAAEDGKVSFITTQDIAAVAIRCLLEEKPHNTDYMLKGAESITYDQMAETLSDVLGRKIVHDRLSGDELYERLLEFEAPPTAKEHIELDAFVATNNPFVVDADDSIERITGHKARNFRQFAESAKQAWE